ncbi:XrtA/PEP-CTERM system exopolysaccharide export protein [Thiobacillus sp.]|uniref:XrtA/PEP-CTERM system exopolysaccharide export protein n=1 Tax=Thiobacillus sp. TaxID=924 RepID=UPI0025E46922|nr:XrtA/PEP-CTERM system exopolysaccharide export protein [Thiobacillus sp.]MBT9538608.1 polysaccharide export protein [Thiobacillus sp.]
MFTINTLIARVSVVFAVAAITGCSSTPTYPPAPIQAPPPVSVDPRVSGWNYLLGPGDSVQVFVWRNPEVSGSFPIRPDGKMTMNLIEDMQASGKTPTQLARDIEKALSKYIQEPIATVIVSGGIGPYNQQIRVLGEATDPQALGYREGMSVVDVMIAAGGLTDFADGNKAYISRIVKENGERVQLGVRLEDLLRDGDSTAAVEMRPGDVLVIPESLF